jgi:hypothetical protein
MEYDMVRKSVIMEDRFACEIGRFAAREDRDFSNAMRYAARIGLIALENPELTVIEIKDILDAQADFETGRVSELKIDEL